MRFFLSLIVWSLVIGHWSLALDNPEQKVTDVIKAYIQFKNPAWLADEIRISYKSAEKTFADLGNSGHNTLIKVAEIFPEFKPAGNVVFPLEIDEAGETRRIFLRAKVEVLKKIVVAAEALKKGSAFSAAGLKVEERDVAMLPPKYFTELKALDGKEAKISIPANSTVFDWMTSEPPLVRQGGEVALIVTAPGLAVRVKGTALESGARGEQIKVKRPGLKGIIFGKVISPTEVEVKP